MSVKMSVKPQYQKLAQKRERALALLERVDKIQEARGNFTGLPELKCFTLSLDFFGQDTRVVMPENFAKELEDLLLRAKAQFSHEFQEAEMKMQAVEQFLGGAA